MNRNLLKLLIAGVCLLVVPLLALSQMNTSDGPPPDVLPAKFVHPVGNATAGQEVFHMRQVKR